MKKILIILIMIALMNLFFLDSAFAEGYLDLEGTVYKEAVENLEMRKIMAGYPDNNFKPNEFIKRCEFAKIAVLTKGMNDALYIQQNKEKISPYPEVPVTHWALDYINLAKKNNLISGFEDGTFRPEQEITYNQAVEVLIKILDLGDYVDKLGDSPNNYIEYSKKLNITEGIEIENWSSKITRGHAAIMVYNTLKILDSYKNIIIDDYSVSFFESDPEGNDNKEIKKIKKFAKNGDKLIGVELKLNHSQLDEDIVLPFNYSIFNENGVLLGTRVELYNLSKETKESILVNTIPWDISDNWVDGKHKLEIKFGQIVIDKASFNVYTDYTYHKKIIKQMEVISLKFYPLKEKGYKPKNERTYGTKFDYSQKYKGYNWEMDVKYPELDKDIIFPVTFKYYKVRKGERKLFFEFTLPASIEASKTTDNWTAGGSARKYSAWSVGEYEVEIYALDVLLAKGKFQIDYE